MHEKSLCAHSLSRSSVKCPQLCATVPNTNVCARAQACMLGCCHAASPVATVPVCIRVSGYQPCALLQLHAVLARTRSSTSTSTLYSNHASTCIEHTDSCSCDLWNRGTGTGIVSRYRYRYSCTTLQPQK